MGALRRRRRRQGTAGADKAPPAPIVVGELPDGDDPGLEERVLEDGETFEAPKEGEVPVPQDEPEPAEAPDAPKAAPAKDDDAPDDEAHDGVDADQLRARIEKTRLAHLQFEDASPRDVVNTIKIVTGMNIVVLGEWAEDAKITIDFKDVELATILDMLTEPYGHTWEVKKNVVVIRGE